MKAFLGLLIIIGVSKLPSLELYLSLEHEDLGPPLVRKVMPRYHFRQLVRCFHTNTIDPLRLLSYQLTTGSIWYESCSTFYYLILSPPTSPIRN